jgi:hypothetical protein
MKKNLKKFLKMTKNRIWISISRDVVGRHLFRRPVMVVASGALRKAGLLRGEPVTERTPFIYGIPEPAP